MPQKCPLSTGKFHFQFSLRVQFIIRVGTYLMLCKVFRSITTLSLVLWQAIEAYCSVFQICTTRGG